MDCKHPQNERYTKVLSCVATCEETVTACLKCGKELDKPKFDCI